MTIVYKLKYSLLLIVLFTVLPLSASAAGMGFTDNPVLYNQAEPIFLISARSPLYGSSAISELADAGVGSSLRVGLGRVGNGWGAGLNGRVRTLSPSGTSSSLAMADIRLDTDFFFGYGRSFSAGSAEISIGGDIVPHVFLRALDVHLPNISAAAGEPDSLSSVLKQVDRLNVGFGLGTSIGAVAEKGPLRGLLNLRDIGHTRFVTYSTTLEDLRNGNLGHRISDPLNTIPMTLGMGFGIRSSGDSVQADILAEYIQPLADSDIIAASKYAFWYERVRIEVESTFSNTLVLRATLDGGIAGAGLRVELNSLEIKADLRSDGGDFTISVPF